MSALTRYGAEKGLDPTEENQTGCQQHEEDDDKMMLHTNNITLEKRVESEKKSSF